jgi:hypothetical protein
VPGQKGIAFLFAGFFVPVKPVRIIAALIFEAHMLLKIVNYGFRGLTIIAGIALLTGLFSTALVNPEMSNVLGALLILFGIYRILQYHYQQRRTEHEE